MSTCTSVEVGRPHSTSEAGEQSRRGSVGRGVRRGKEVDQGERTTSALVPDTEPGKRVTGVVARTTSCVLRNGWPSDEPEVRAVGGNSSRTDLCGGPLARAVPTATRKTQWQNPIKDLSRWKGGSLQDFRRGLRGLETA